MIIILNGTSSSGKSSIAKELKKILPEPYFLFGVDQFLENSLPHDINFERKKDFDLVLRAISGFNKSLHSLAGSVDNFIVDHVLDKDEWLHQIASALKGFDTFFVGVKAPLKVIEGREASRPNRKPGTAKEQFSKINSIQYDFEVDTSSMSPSEAALNIRKNLKRGQALKKFE